MTKITTTAASLATLCSVASAKMPAQAPKSSPNILLILADDLGWVDTSFTGSRLYETPNIERLAKRGMFFPNAYSASPLCSPTRASIMTGQSPARTGFTTPGGHLKQEVLKASVQAKAAPTRRTLVCNSITRLDTAYHTLANGLKDAGYATGHFGKWHLGHEPYSPLEHGFDVDIPHWPGPGPAGSFVAPWRFPNFKPRTPKEHIEDRMGDEAVAFMTEHKDEPFYLNYWQFSVHAPFDAKQEYIDAYKPGIDQDYAQRSPTYAAMVKSLDDNVGKMLDALDELGIADHTIVIFYSDNGGNMYDRVDDTTPTSNDPLRGGKASIYEGGIRIPAIVAWPGEVKPGTRNEALVQSEDLYPTILAMAGAAAKDGQACDGLSMLPALRGEAPLRDAIYSYFPHAPAVPDWTPPSVCVRKGDWKLIRIFFDAPDQSHRYELYNLAGDIGEQDNLAAREPERVRELDALLDRFLADTEAVLPKPNPAYDPKAVEDIGGWRVGEGGYGTVTFNARMKTLQLRAFTDDVVLTTSEPLDLPAGTYMFRVRMESFTSQGDGFVAADGARVPILTTHDRHWQRYEVKLQAPGGIPQLSFSPCSKPGTTQIESIELLKADGDVMRTWRFTKTGPKSKKPKKAGQPQKKVAGWTGGSNGHVKLSVRAKALHLVSTGGDPMLMGEVPPKLGPGTYRFAFRMRSDSTGDGQVFGRPKSRGYLPGTGHRFAVQHDGHWNDYKVEMTLDHELHELRLDPCTAQGKLDIEWIRLEAADGTVVRTWDFGKVK
jgi:arylsulfatase A-like enzyme